MSTQTMLQYFEWYLPEDGRHWHRTVRDAEHLARLGFTDVWLPPAYKGHEGMRDVGYGVYDLYDLGEFPQKGSTATKYGTKDEYLDAIRALHSQKIRVLGDIVLNHRMGADYCEPATGAEMAKFDRLHYIRKRKKLEVWTGFDFPGRDGKYSAFRWNKSHFSGTDWNNLTGKKGIFKLEGHFWSTKVDDENVNYDYLMGANVDFSVPEVVEELKFWGKWYMDFTGLDGVRLDAVKHISYAFFPGWLRCIRDHMGHEAFAVGEYWSSRISKLTKYLENCGHCMTLFDVPLQHKFHQASRDGAYFDLRKIFEHTLLEREPAYAVTIVDNHDTQPGQPLKTWVKDWFKPLGYAMILLRDKGIPCVFFGDLYGIPHDNIAPVRGLEKLLLARKHFGHGAQTDYFDHPNVVGWTRDSGMAVLISNGSDGHKYMKLGHPGQVYVDLLGNCADKVTINGGGWGEFKVRSRSVSVWVPEDQARLVK